MAEERLSESVRSWILQMALTKVKSGRDPTEPMSDAEKASYERTVNDLLNYKEMVGDKKFAETTFDVGYDI